MNYVTDMYGGPFGNGFLDDVGGLGDLLIEETLLEEMASVDIAQPADDTRKTADLDLLDESITRQKLQKDFANAIGNGIDLHNVSRSEDFLLRMWPPESCPAGVLREVEVCSSYEEEDSVDKTFLDLVAAQNQDCSDYGSDSGAEQADSDLSHTTLLPLTNHRFDENRRSFDVPRTNSFEMRLPGSEIKISSPGSNRKYTSGGSMHLNSAVSLLATDLVGVCKTETGYPSLRVKQEVDRGLNPCNHYEPHQVYNHAHQYMNDVSQTSLPYNTEQATYMYSHSNQHSYHDNHVDLPKVKVENVYPSPCNIPTVVTSNIPNIVTSPDDQGSDSGTESVNSRESDCSKSNKDKRRPGRKKGQVSKVYHLWEFIRDVLADPRYCPSVVKWENEPDGIFRVIQSEVMAGMWGAKKNNRTKMTYEKMSRSIRYSRKEGYFADLPKNKGYPKKLCFKFGEKACGWSKTYS